MENATSSCEKGRFINVSCCCYYYYYYEEKGSGTEGTSITNRPIKLQFREKDGSKDEAYKNATAGLRTLKATRKRPQGTDLRHPSLEEGAGKRCSECAPRLH